jgi:hypothetical protein
MSLTGTLLNHITAYSSDAVYLYSTRDEPQSERVPTRVPILSRNTKRRKLDPPDEAVESSQSPDTHGVDIEMMDCEVDQSDADDVDEELCNENNEPEESTDVDIHGSIPVILPRTRFSGACNVETIKDGKLAGPTVNQCTDSIFTVNFLGPKDEYVTSGEHAYYSVSGWSF